MLDGGGFAHAGHAHKDHIGIGAVIAALPGVYYDQSAVVVLRKIVPGAVIETGACKGEAAHKGAHGNGRGKVRVLQVHIGGVVDEVAEPHNILLFQNFAANPAVVEVSRKILCLHQQLLFGALVGYLPQDDVKLAFHHLAGQGKGGHLQDFLFEKFFLLGVGGGKRRRQLGDQGRNVHRTGYGKKFKGVLYAGHARCELLDQLMFFALAEQVDGDGVYFQITEYKLVSCVEIFAFDILDVDKLIGCLSLAVRCRSLFFPFVRQPDEKKSAAPQSLTEYRLSKNHRSCLLPSDSAAHFRPDG